MEAIGTRREILVKPVSWILATLAIFAIPLIGFVVKGIFDWETLHPALNATLNASSGLFLFLGYRAIKSGNRLKHAQYMVSAFTFSSVFLCSYLIRYYISGVHRYPGEGLDKTLYLSILTSHTFLAMTVVPLVIWLFVLVSKGNYTKHAKVAKVAWPIWIYVSITGVVVYFMLYHYSTWT